MKKIYISIYSAIAILIMLGTVFGFVYGLIQDAEKGSEEAKRSFNFFATSAVTLAEKDAFAETVYTKKLRRLAQELDLKAFVISSPQTKMQLSWFKEPDVITYTEEKGFSAKTISPFIKYFNADISVKTEGNEHSKVKVYAAVSSVKPEAIYSRSRTVFFASLTVFLLTFIIILLQTMSSSSEKVYANFPPHNDDFDELYYDEIKRYDSGFERTSYSNRAEKESRLTRTEREYTLEDLENLNLYKKYPYEKDYAAKNDSFSSTSSEDVFSQNTFENTNKGGYGAPAYSSPETADTQSEDIPYVSAPTDTTSPFQEETEASLPKASDTKNTQETYGLYAPVTGITRNEHFAEFLEMELKRAASSEQDLALMVIRLKEFTVQSLVAKKIASFLIDLIKFKDRIFEFGEDGFSVIMQDMDLDASMKTAEQVYRGIKTIMEEYNIFEPIAIGITTRTSRLLSSERLIEEASKAAERAMSSSDEPIVAFKVNPEQYRRFISEK